jgi:hypothetical protein
VTWDAARMASGIYLYTMTACPVGQSTERIFSSTKKLILLK